MRVHMKPDTKGYPTPLIVVGTNNADGTANAMAVAWGGVCSSEPPCMMIAIRKNRLTYENILREKAFTVHVAGAEQVKEADYFGLVSGRKADKLAQTAYHTSPAQCVNAPIIEEFPFAMECVCLETHEVGQHIVIIGEVKDLSANPAYLKPDGTLDLQRAGVLLYDQCENLYYRMGDVVGKAFSAGMPYLKEP